MAAEHVFLREGGADLRSWSALAELWRGVADAGLDRRVAQIRRQDMDTPAIDLLRSGHAWQAMAGKRIVLGMIRVG